MGCICVTDQKAFTVEKGMEEVGQGDVLKEGRI